MNASKQLSSHQKKPNKRSQPTEQLTFLEHFYELRKRVFWVVLTLVLASAIGFQVKDQLIAAIMAPLHGERLIYLTPTGGFSFIFTLSIYFGALLTIPVAVYHLYRFLEPLLGETSRKLVACFIGLSALLAAAGAAFGYYVTIPAAINFLSDFAGETVTPSLTAESYLGFVVAYVLGLAALFQLPLLLFIVDHVRPLKPGFLSSTQRFVIVGATVIAAIITPTPDAVNMAIVAVPIVVVYEFGALAVYARRKTSGHEASMEDVDDLREEPLTAILEELSVQEEEAAAVEQQPVRQEPTAPVVPSRSEPQPRPVPTPRPVAARPSRSLDGFAPRSRQLSPPLTIPNRSNSAVPSPRSDSSRSLDGFSTVA